MHYHRLSVLSILTPAVLAVPLVSPWGNMLVKHEWNNSDIPDNWLALGHPPDGTTIDLHIALKPDRENALINALYKVSQPRHPKHILFSTPLLKVYSHVPLLQTRCPPVKGAGY